ncbi:MAG: DUF2911 domain-containing protein [Cyclobacteriaceae bacterium]
MLKKVLIGVGILAVVLVGLLAYLNNRNRTLSPPGSAEASNQELSVSVNYSRPSVRDRLIFGPAEEDALQPYGIYWRLGANEATEITFSTDVLFGGKMVPKGTYTLYAVPGSKSFVIGVNSSLDRWGYSEPDYDQDVAKIIVPVEKAGPTEQFTIDLVTSGNGINMLILWSEVKLTIPIVAQ